VQAHLVVLVGGLAEVCLKLGDGAGNVLAVLLLVLDQQANVVGEVSVEIGRSTLVVRCYLVQSVEQCLLGSYVCEREQ
jgi:hypothetical protein